MTDQELQAELLQRMRRDQDAREQVEGHSDDPRQAEWAEVARVDHDNTAWLSAVVAQRGWPRLSQVGEEAATAAWLIAQHADHTPELQAAFHRHMTTAAAVDEASPRLLAYLDDRVRVNAGRPQLYGSQFISDETGALRPQPIDHAETLDDRRAAVGMEPFDEYEATMHHIWAREPD